MRGYEQMCHALSSDVLGAAPAHAQQQAVDRAMRASLSDENLRQLAGSQHPSPSVREPAMRACGSRRPAAAADQLRWRPPGSVRAGHEPAVLAGGRRVCGGVDARAAAVPRAAGEPDVACEPRQPEQLLPAPGQRDERHLLPAPGAADTRGRPPARAQRCLHCRLLPARGHRRRLEEWQAHRTAACHAGTTSQRASLQLDDWQSASCCAEPARLATPACRRAWPWMHAGGGGGSAARQRQLRRGQAAGSRPQVGRGSGRQPGAGTLLTRPRRRAAAFRGSGNRQLGQRGTAAAARPCMPPPARAQPLCQPARRGQPAFPGSATPASSVRRARFLSPFTSAVHVYAQLCPWGHMHAKVFAGAPRGPIL